MIKKSEFYDPSLTPCQKSEGDLWNRGEGFTLEKNRKMRTVEDPHERW